MERKISIGIAGRARGAAGRFTEEAGSLVGDFIQLDPIIVIYSHWQLRGVSNPVAMLCGSE